LSFMFVMVSEILFSGARGGTETNAPEQILLRKREAAQALTIFGSHVRGNGHEEERRTAMKEENGTPLLWPKPR